MTPNDLIIYLVLAVLSVVNIIVPISGSATVTPFLAILTDPHKAIGLASFYFLMSGPIRIFLFRKNIQWQEIKILLPFSLIAAFVGAFALVAINPTLLLFMVLLSAIYFFLKKINILPPSKKESLGSKYTTGLVGLFSGFLQGAGFAGSALRNSYLFGKNLNIAELHGTTAVVGFSIFFVATIVRLFTDQLTIPDLIPLLYIFPFILAGTLLGRKILYKFSEKTTNVVVILIMIAIIVLLSQKILMNLL